MVKWGVLFLILGGITVTSAWADDVVIDLSVLDALDDGNPLMDDSSLVPLPKPEIKSLPKVSTNVEKKVNYNKNASVKKIIPLPEVKPSLNVQKTKVKETTRHKSLSNPEKASGKQDDSSQKIKETLPQQIKISSETTGKNTDDQIIIENNKSTEQFIQTEIKQSVVDKKISENKEEKSLPPLIPVDDDETIKDETNKENQIIFADESDRLSLENIDKLSDFANSFELPGENKIIISAYNFEENNQNSFKSKRLNLNRAVAVRSYFMKHGYKNFSIRIVNTENPNKKNVTEIIEEKD